MSALLLCLVLAGCGAASGAGSKEASAHGSRAEKRPYALETSLVQGLGKVLVDAEGYVLYAYVPDRQGASRCYRVCAVEWPPFDLPPGVKRPVAGRGVRSGLLGTTRRRNGTLQVTYDHWPLYLYRQDHVPGVATGQGDDMGLWYVVSPVGSLDR